MYRFILSVALLSVLFFSGALAGPPPAMEPMPGPLGVNIHFTQPQRGEMRELAGAGFKWVRMDFAWGAIERKKGEFDFQEYDGLMDELDRSHIRPIFILDYSNRFYDNGQSPASDEGRAAFANWAAASVKHFKGRGIVWEMYNEPNIGFWKPHPDVGQYARLALAVGKAIRQAEPDETYIGPGSSTIDLPFIEACFKAGCLEYWSAVSVHPYRQSDPETVAAEYRALHKLIDQYAPAGKQIPIISSEWGYSSAWRDFDEQRQARYLPRELMVNVMNGVPISIWYDWHEDGVDPHDGEHHFGVVHHDADPHAEPTYDPKPAYLAMKTLSTSLAGFTFKKRLTVGNESDYVLLWVDAKSNTRLAAWTTAHGPHAVKIPTGEGTFVITRLTGGKSDPVAADHGQLSLALTDSVQYVSSN